MRHRAFSDDRWWDVFAKYAQTGPEEILMQVTVHNRSPQEATIHALPQLWFHNPWSWRKDGMHPMLEAKGDGVFPAVLLLAV